MAADYTSFVRLSCDLILYRVMWLFNIPSHNLARTISIQGGFHIHYRLNRGDIWAIYEVWMCGAYQLPFSVQPGTLVDLGANIGLTSLWYAKTLGFKSIIAVEPSEGNAAIARLNMVDNAISARVIGAAVGSRDGGAIFREYNWSTYNEMAFSSDVPRPLVNGLRLVRESPVPVISLETIIAELDFNDRISLLKLDIEGSEQELISRNPSWLSRVDAMVVEFHPPRADVNKLLYILKTAGLEHIPPSEKFPMHSFVRPSSTAHSPRRIALTAGE
jgi:FkbM family methyltransferase